MRSSFVLGIAGGIITFLVGGFVLILGSFLSAFGAAHGTTLLYLTAVNFVGGAMGIVGGAVGRKKGGIIMIIGGVLALIGASLFGVLGLVLLVVGGCMAFREAKLTKPRQETI